MSSLVPYMLDIQLICIQFGTKQCKNYCLNADLELIKERFLLIEPSMKKIKQISFHLICKSEIHL